MNQAKKRELKPKLRFPEFRDAEDWEEEKLLEVCDINPSNEELPDFFIYIDLESVVAGKLIYKKKICKKDAPSRAQRLLKNGDVIYQIVRPYQRNNFLFNLYDKNNYVASTGYAQLRSFGVSEFLYQLIHTDTFVNKVIAKCTGSNYPAINSSDLAEINVAIPLHSEQKKIADCLSSIDDRITAETQKLSTLKVHKKGLMQQLFPAEGETVPDRRFPEFHDAGKWEEKALEQLAKRGSGHTPNKNNPEYYNGGIRWVSLADSNKLDDGLIYETKVKISREGIENSSAVLHPSGTVIISRDAGVGKSAILHCEMAVSQHFMAWICDNSKLSNWFLYYLLQIMKPILESIAVGSTIKTIGLPYFKALRISIPPLAEQQKIADCFTSIDELITAQTQKIHTLKTHKKGLMQQLFSAVEDAIE